MDKNLKIGLIIGGILLAILIVSPLLAGLVTGWETCEYEMKEYGMMGGFGIGWFMPIIWIVIVGLIVWAVVTLTRGMGRTREQDHGKQTSALEILKGRYARAR